MGLALALAVFLAAPSAALPDPGLQALVSSGVLPGLHWPNFTRLQPDVAGFYELNGYQLAWVRAGLVTRQGRALMGVLQNAALKGLDPDDYDAWRWNLPDAGPERFDLALSVSAIRYIHDVSSGKVDPAVFDFGLKFHQPRCDLREAAYGLINSPDVVAALERLEPPFEGYWRTEKALEQYLALARDVHRIRQLQLVLERWRWVPHSFARPPIVVNIPEFRLRAYNAEYRPVLEMKVVVGKAYHHKTPVFSSEMTHVIFRPYWDVPLSIQRAELAPELAKDPEYLAKNDYEIVDSGRHVVSKGPVSTDMLEQIRSGKLFVRQTPGDKNALGLIKFLFPNEYDVYLHGTPAKALFLRTRRDFSHGCIRVEKPEELALWVLRGVPGWDLDRIRAAEKGTDSLRVNLAKPIPVLIVYGTAVVSPDGEVHLFADIYGFDAELEEVLDHGYPYSGWQPASVRTSANRELRRTR
ncbi:MAG TPA: L,D-transpeptidase family protein [Bryobacteraceae bacterium]|nr:L,D-transpeptidase family protein [Bryobacteraceae bacterium]